MPTLTPEEIRKQLLDVVAQMVKSADPAGNSLYTSQPPSKVWDMVPRPNRTPDVERMILTEWQELFRTGYLAYGMNIGNPGHDWFHLTGRGSRTLQRLSRDPANPSGYRAYLAGITTLNPIAKSYLDEGLDCFVAGHFKAAAVMTGAAAESLVLELRDAVVDGLKSIKQPIPKQLGDWRVKVILDAIQTVIASHSAALPKSLRDEFQAHWSAFAHQVRTTRNDAGHPTSVEPVTESATHSLFLMLPILAQLSEALSAFARDGFK